jgi:hypothetical protein
MEQILGVNPMMKFRDFIKLTPEQKNALLMRKQASHGKKSVNRQNHAHNGGN